ncbi:tetratricopeptide repeat-containing protein [Rathayibacter sp. AY1G9]|uniref:tetratricopeptide repeat-containing protein n=1 Tax=Rathayibacter sp. AY1G9 TaxID=2080565 RepID=UPI000CE768F3|nr:tetratricopeptide repeat-containing protein [Rathayibacter sp. AY1G9]PPG99860.1 tetratricopeptide repeat-containing protein [Rathayibacter sp. AY1G9]
MDEAATVERADLLWQEGRRAAALDLLRGQVRRSPSDTMARLALIAKYRELSAPDQAGRWGLALDGETSDFERDRAARLLAGAGLHDRDLPDFLALPCRDLPREVLELLPLVEHYRGQFDQKPPDQEPPPSDWLEFAALVLWLSSVGLAVVAMVIVWGGAAFGTQMTAFARWSGVVCVGIAALGCVAQGCWRLRSGSRALGWTWLVPAVFVATGLTLLITAAIQSGGELLFTWEK